MLNLAKAAVTAMAMEKMQQLIAKSAKSKKALMMILRFNSYQREWQTPLPALAPILKQALRIQWREFINEIEDTQDSDNSRMSTDIATISMLEKAFKAS